MMKTSIMDIDTEVVEDVEDIDVDTGVDVDGIYVNSLFPLFYNYDDWYWY